MTDDPKFNQWWDEHGQFVRSGGGQYEISFAWAAWQAARATAEQRDSILEECALICEAENPATGADCARDIRALKSQQDAAIESKAAEQSLWQPIETAPKDDLIDLWIDGPGARRIANCRWGVPQFAGVGGLAFKPEGGFQKQWVTMPGFGLDPRNGVATHWKPLPTPPADAAIESQRSGDGS